MGRNTSFVTAGSRDGTTHLLCSPPEEKVGVNACLSGPYLRFGAASYPERLLRFLPGGNLTQSAIGLTPFQASCDVGDVAEICMKRDKNICGFGHRQRLVTTGLKAEREREREREKGKKRTP